MGRFGLACFTVFSVLTIIFASAISEEHNVDEQLLNTDPATRDIHWYIRRKPGFRYVLPKIQRRKRNSAYDEGYRTPALERDQLESLMDTVQEPPWAVVTINEGKRHTVNFTPRLGRESGEENDATENWIHDTELSRELMTQRSPPFAPRLGRRMSTYYFDPRLGKRNDPQKQL